MPRYIQPKSVGVAAVAVCPRCHFKVNYTDLVHDGDVPGLLVCVECKDLKDPYKLPVRKAEKISLQHPRPDTELELSSEPPFELP